MKNNPLITIATVTYNAASLLDRTLDSVAEQDYPDIEHLIVDGRSKDGTLMHIQRYVERNGSQNVPHNIRLICEHDDGLYDAMNKAIAQATGDYIVFLNAGDTLKASDTISNVVACMDWIAGDNHNPAVVYGETDLVDSQGAFVRHRRLQVPPSLSWRSFKWGMLVCHQSFYVRTDLARATAYNLHWRFSADFDWAIRLLKMAERRRLPIVNAQRVLTNYLNEGLTTQNHRKSLLERLRIMAQHYGWPTTIFQHLLFAVRALVKK